MGKDLTAVKNARNASQLQVVINGMMKRWGGVPGFLETWNEFRESAPLNGSYQAKSVLAMMNMMLKHGAMQDRNGAHLQSQLASMPDEQLESVIRDHLAKLMAEQPEWAAMELRNRGWTVMAPQECDGDPL